MKTPMTFFFLLLLLNQVTFGQDAKVKFGKIDPDDLAMKVYAPDTNANAVILLKTGSIRYDLLQEKFIFNEYNHVVLKILKEAGLDEYGNVELKYYTHHDFSRINNLKAMVHLPDGTEVKVDNDQIFDEETNDYWSKKKIAFPKLVVGAIIEYEYNLVSQGVFHPVDWYFQKEIPIVTAVLTTKIPKFLDYVILTEGEPLDDQKTEYTYEQYNTSSINRGMFTIGHAEQSSINSSSEKVEFTLRTYTNKDVPALKEECCITTMDDYYSRVRYQLKSYEYSEGMWKPVMNSWQKVAEELYNIPEWGGQLLNKRPGQLVLEAAGVDVATASNQKDIVQAVYHYINHNIQWNKLYSVSSDLDINALLKSKSGDSGDLNKMACAALRQAGIEAKPVLISTRSNGKTLELYPFVDQFNHMIVLAKVDGKDMWIDQGNPDLPLGQLAEESLNGRGWVADQTAPFWTDLVAPSTKTIFLLKGAIDQNGLLNGTVESRFTGYHALHQRNRMHSEKDKYGSDQLSCNRQPVPLTEMELINADDPSMPFQFKGKIVNYPMATATPDRIYINPVIPDGLDDLPFKLLERTYPIEMTYPFDITMIVNLELPQDFKLEALPEPIRYTAENGGVQITYNISNVQGKLNISMIFAVTKLQFLPTDYPMLKNLYGQRHDKFNEQIVLSKI
ncbi:MAG TPA: DUF3857 and transglutaminase domain-containing protein [Saprospiraceae bacterium]|nr:DUF3857 and transglutaminase domain-containing protein [Saprospiraceae bacterium]